MTVQYTQWEQQKIDALEELDAARWRREHVNEHLYERVKKEAELAEYNAACCAEYQAKLAAQEAAKRRAVEETKQQAIQERIETFKRQAQARFPGTSVEFEAQWPALLSEWQRRQVLDADEDPAVAEIWAWLRQNLGYNRL